MGRNSLRLQRIEEILDALEICILREDLQNISLEAIANQAKMKRSILRHYIGNKNDIIIHFSKRWHQRQVQEWEYLLANLPKENQLVYIIDYLFNFKNTNHKDIIIADYIFFEMKHNKELKKQVKEYIDIFIYSLATQINLEFPDVKIEDCKTISYGIYSLYFSGEYFSSLNFDYSFVRDFKKSIEYMLQGINIDIYKKS